MQEEDKTETEKILSLKKELVNFEIELEKMISIIKRKEVKHKN